MSESQELKERRRIAMKRLAESKDRRRREREESGMFSLAERGKLWQKQSR